MSAVPALAPRLTIADLERPEYAERRCELWEGEIIDMPPAVLFHNLIIARLLFEFDAFARKRGNVRWLPPGSGVRLDSETLLIPDLALYRNREDVGGVYFSGSPELVVEVASPGNTAAEFARKRRLYFAHGAEQVWIMFPEQGVVDVYHREGRIAAVTGGVLSGEGIAEGLGLDLAALFAPMPGAQQGA